MSCMSSLAFPVDQELDLPDASAALLPRAMVMERESCAWMRRKMWGSDGDSVNAVVLPAISNRHLYSITIFSHPTPVQTSSCCFPSLSSIHTHQNAFLENITDCRYPHSGAPVQLLTCQGFAACCSSMARSRLPRPHDPKVHARIR